MQGGSSPIFSTIDMSALNLKPRPFLKASSTKPQSHFLVTQDRMKKFRLLDKILLGEKHYCIFRRSL